MGRKWTIQDVQLVKARQLQPEKKVTRSRVKKSIPQSANNLTQQTLRLLKLKGFYAWRQNNSGVYDPIKKVYRANSVKRGVSDILGFQMKTGVIIAIEIKYGKDRLSLEQDVFLQQVKDSGGIARVFRTIEDLERFAKEF